MARSRKKDRFLRRRPQAARGDDRISALSDDLLLLILRRLDTRTALGAGLLSRRWSCLPRELPALDFRVGDILPPRYHRLILLYSNTTVTPSDHELHATKKKLKHIIRRYEALTGFIKTSLDAAGGGVLGGGPGRRISRLRLEFFATLNTGCMNQLFAKAVDAWGVDDLEAVATPIFREQAAHSFPSHGLCEEPRASRLRSLKLGGCFLPPLHGYSALTRLVLQGLPESTSEAAYEGVFTSCPQLQVMDLISCQCKCGVELVVDAPRSEIRELVVDGCEFVQVCMRALPGLERLASLGPAGCSLSPPHFPTSGNVTLPCGAVSYGGKDLSYTCCGQSSSACILACSLDAPRT